MKVHKEKSRNFGKLENLYRKISLLTLLVFGAIQWSFADARNLSRLELRVWNNGPFELTLNNRTYFGNGVVQLNDLRPGTYHITVTQRRQNAYGYGGGGVSSLYRGKITIPARRAIKAEVNRNRRVRILTSMLIRPQYQNCTGTVSCTCGNHYQQPIGNCGTPPAQIPPACGTHTCNMSCNHDQSQWQGHNDHYNDHGHDQWSDGHDDWGYEEQWHSPVTPAPALMHNQDFQRLIDQLEDNFFDDQRMVIAQQAIGNKAMTTGQVVQILETFNFESTRLEFAKYAYTKVVDQDRYYMVNDSFNFSSSVHELNDYIGRV